MSTSTKTCPSLPTELWTYILRWSTIESEHLSPQTTSGSFGWPYDATFDSSFFRSVATKCSLVLVSRRFEELASEFLYETVHLGGTRKIVALTQQCKENIKIANYLRFWTKSLYIVPVFNPVTTEPDVEEMNDILQMFIFIAQTCTGLRNVMVRADTVTLFHGPTYQPWVQILDALPPGLRHLTVENFLLGPVVWKPRLFNRWNTSSELRTLRLDAEHPPFEHHFPCLTHLWLFSWLPASQWDMPSLSNLYIDYFPGNNSTSSFWTAIRPQLKLLHFGGDTDFGLYFPDLPQRLQTYTPNLKTLEYHCAGDLDILWDPTQLPHSLERVTIRLEESIEAHSMSYPLTVQDVLLQYTSAGFSILLELLTDLCPSGAHRWLRIERHMEKYGSHPVKLFVILPPRIASLVQFDDPPPLIRSPRFPSIGT